MKTILSSSISLLTLFGIATFFYSYKVSAIFFVLAILVAMFSIFVLGSRVQGVNLKRLYALIVVSVLALIAIIYFLNIEKSREIIAARNSKSLSDSFITKKPDQVATTKEENIENMLQNLQLKLSNKLPESEILEYMSYMEKVGLAKLSTTTPKSYSDMGKIYEAAFVLGITKDASLAINNYNYYCKLEPTDPECYATIARFLSLDKNNKKQALEYAKKALELSKSDMDIAVYNALVEYIVKM